MITGLLGAQSTPLYFIMIFQSEQTIALGLAASRLLKEWSLRQLGLAESQG